MSSRGAAVVTGANRQAGIGLALALELRRRGYEPVVASYRVERTAAALLEAAARDGGLIPLRLDVSTDDGVLRFAQECGAVTGRIAALVNNAGVPSSALPIDQACVADLIEHVQVHAAGMLRVTQALLPLMASGSVVANISSVLSSVGGICAGYTFYAPAKALQNALTRQLAERLMPRRISVIALHPGWVATDIGGQGAPLLATEAARGLADLIESATLRDTGTFRDHRGRVLAW